MKCCNNFPRFGKLREDIQYRRADAAQNALEKDMKSNGAAYQAVFEELVKKTEYANRLIGQAKECMARGDIEYMGTKLSEANRAILWLNEEIRRMLLLFPGEQEETYPALAAEKMAEEITVKYTDEGWLYISMYALLPHKKKAPGKTNIYYSLSYAIMRFLENHEQIRFDRAVMIVRQVYGQGTPARYRKDGDNIETAAVINAVSAFFLRDDSSDVLSLYTTASAGGKDRTEVFLVPEKSFIPWNLRYKRVSL